MTIYDWIPNWNDFKSFFKERWFVLYFLAFVILLLGCMYYSQNFYKPAPFQRTEQELRVKADLESEIHSLQVIPGALYSSIYSNGDRDSHNSWSASFSFETELAFSAVYRYYDKQLKAHGWEETSVRNNSAHYKKNFYEAKLSVSEEKQNRYYISLTWHQRSESPPSKTNVIVQAVGLIVIICGLLSYFVLLLINSWKSKK